MNINTDLIGQVISFEVWPANILGSNFNNLRLDAIMDAATAALYGVDTPALHANVYPTLPAGTSNRHDGYAYAKLTTPAKTTVVVGLPWIKSDSVQLVDSIRAVVEVENLTVDKLRLLRDVLLANGFTSIKINT